jgi:hypothetical protein
MSQTNSQRFKRRLRTYSGRAKSAVSGGIKHPVFFMHLPKCGGTSVAEALYATVPLQKRVGVIDANATRRTAAILHDDVNELHVQHDDLSNSKNVYNLREGMLINHMAWNSQMIHGHVLFSAIADRHFGYQYKYVTVLREPISRTLSNFAHTISSGMIADDFDAYLAGPMVRAHGLTFLRYFSGTPVLDKHSEEDALVKAKSVLEKFSVIGFLDDLPKFCDDYKTALGVRPRIGLYNQAKGSTFQPSEAQLERLKRILRTEIAFWNYARRLKGIA